MNHLNRADFDQIKSVRLDKRGKRQVILQSEKYTTVILFDHNGKIVTCDEYECEKGDELDPSVENISCVFNDSDGHVYRIFNKTEQGE